MSNVKIDTPSQKRRRNTLSSVLNGPNQADASRENTQVSSASSNTSIPSNQVETIEINDGSSSDEIETLQSNLSEILKTNFEEVLVTSKNNTQIQMIQCKECKKNNLNKYYLKTTSKTNLMHHLETIHSIKHNKKPRRKENENIDQEKIDRALLLCIILSFLPFSIVENESFKDFVSSLNSKYEIPSRKKLGKLLDDFHHERKRAVHNNLSSANFVSLTTDSWTSCQNYNYMSLTCHYLDNFKLKSIALGFKNVISHTADSIKNAILEILDNFDLKDKVFSIATDNAANVRRAALNLNFQQEPIRCMGHVLQLIVKKFIEKCEECAQVDVTDIEQGELEKNCSKFGKILSKCRSIVCSFSHSPQLSHLLEESQKGQKSVLSVVQDVKTRWHSTLAMIERISKLHSYIETIFHRQEYKNLKTNLLNKDELDLLPQVISLLSPFDRVSQTLSGEEYVTSAMIYPGFKYIEKKLNLDRKDTNLTKDLKVYLKSCYSDYLRDYDLESNPLILASTFLNPFYKKFDFVTPELRSECLKKAKSYLMDLFKSKKFDQIISKTKEEQVNKINCLKKKLSFDSDSDTDNEDCEESLNIRKEIKNYLADEHNEDILVYWKEKKHEFPILSSLACAILATPATSVSSERFFSHAGYQLWDRRNRLSITNFEKIMFIYENRNL